MKEVTTYTPEQFEAEYGEEDSPAVPQIGGLNALMASVGGTDLAFVPAEGTDVLERDGSQFILISCALLEQLGCPVDARDFVLIMEGVANGNYTTPFPVTDEQLSGFTGLSTETLRQKRKALRLWQEARGGSLIEIVKGGFNTSTGRNDPTRYRVQFIRNVADFVRDARHNRAFQRNPVRAIENAEGCGLSVLIDDVRKELLPDEEKKEPKEKNVTPEPTAEQVSERLRKTVLGAVQRWSDHEFEQGEDVLKKFDKLLIEARRTASEARRRFDARVEKQKPNKRRGRGYPK